MRLLLIRHGETTTSGQSYAGRRDVPLTAQGQAQAQQLARDLADEPLSAVWCSPLSRAMDTARPLAIARDLVPVIDPDLRELDFGQYEGRSKAALGLNLRKMHAHLPLPDGESLHAVWERAARVLQRLALARREPGASCAVVGHFWINRMIWGQAMGLTFEAACRARDYRPATGSCVELSLAETAKFLSWENN